MGGIVGRLFREFAVTLAVAIAISAIISLTLTPMMTSRLLLLQTGRPRGFAFRASEGFFTAMLGGYRRALTWVLRHHHLMLFITIGAAVLSVFLYRAVPKGLFSPTGHRAACRRGRGAAGCVVPAMRQRAEAVKQGRAGPSGRGGDGHLHRRQRLVGQHWEHLHPASSCRAAQPERRPGHRRIAPKLAQIPGIALFLQSVQDVRMGGGARARSTSTPCRTRTSTS